MDTLERLAAAYAALSARIEEAQEQQAQIRSQILDSIDYGTHPAGQLKVMVQHNRRLDPSALQKQYPVAAHPELYKAAIDTTAVKRHIAPAELDNYYIDGAPKLVVQ